MSNAELKLMEQYNWLIPNEPVTLSRVIDQITKKFTAIQIEYGDIPNLRMHKFNAIHLPKNEQINLTAEQVTISAIRIPISDKVLHYTTKDFTPVMGKDGDAGYIYLAYEEQLGYQYSNSNKLFLEVVLMQGLSQEEIHMNSGTAKDFFFYLRSYDELYGNLK